MIFLEIEGITADANQSHTIEREGGNVVIDLRYHPQIQQWTMDVLRGTKGIYNVKLSTGVGHIKAQNMGVDFAVVAEADFDPFRIDDFESGRCILLAVFDV